MKDKALVIVLALALVASVVYGVVLQRRLATLRAVVGQLNARVLTEGDREALTQLRADAQMRQTEAATQQQQLKTALEEMKVQLEQQSSERADLQNKLRELEQQVAAAAPESQPSETPALLNPNRTGDEASSPEAGAQSAFGDWAKALNTPEMKQMIEAQQKMMLDMSYGPLYGLLNLPEDQLTSLKDLLARKQMGQVEAGLKFLDGSATPEEREQQRELMKTTREQVDQEIKNLLGDANYEVYKAYEETQQERMQVNLYNQTLGPDMQLNEAQTNELIWSMHEATEGFDFTSGLEDEANFDPSLITPSNVETHLREMGQLHEQYIQRASQILNPAQLEQFKTSLQQQREMQEVGLRLFSGSGAPAAPANP